MPMRLIDYQYDPLDRLACHTLFGQPPALHFYRQGRVASLIMGQNQAALLNAGHRLLAFQQIGQTQRQHWLTATDPQDSILYGLGSTRLGLVYSPYGIASSNAVIAEMPAFTGEKPDPITGHYPLGNGARFFNPLLMRFNTPDNLSPFGKGGINTYAYCAGNPVTRSDPSGRGWKFNLFSRHRRSSIGQVAGSEDAGIMGTIYQSLNRSTESLAAPSQSRAHLQRSLGPAERETFFGRRLAAVNENLASHANANLTLEQANQYAVLARRVGQGDISSTSAHFSAASGWASQIFTGPHPRASTVGAVFNFAAAFTTAASEAGMRKTGAALSTLPGTLLERNAAIRK